MQALAQVKRNPHMVHMSIKALRNPVTGLGLHWLSKTKSNFLWPHLFTIKKHPWITFFTVDIFQLGHLSQGGTLSAELQTCPMSLVKSPRYQLVQLPWSPKPLSLVNLQTLVKCAWSKTNLLEIFSRAICWTNRKAQVDLFVGRADQTKVGWYEE